MNPSLYRKYFPQLSDFQTAQLESLNDLYRDWNSKINVISRKDIDQLAVHHVLHSLAIANLVQFAPGTKVIDAGTGGGFPGIPLAIFFPDVKFHLVDSIGKKIKVVQEISSSIGLKNISAEKIRAEEVKGKYDFAVSRAVAPLKEMIGWLSPLIQKGNKSSIQNGMIFLKGGDLADEIAESGKSIQLTDLSEWFDEDYFLAKKILYLQV